MGKRVNVTIYVDKDVVREAKEVGLNISKVCENALKDAIRRLKSENCKNTPGVGFEPTRPDWATGSQGRRLGPD